MAILESLAGLTRLRDLKYESGYTPLDFKPLPAPNRQGFQKNELNARTDDLGRLTNLLTSNPAGLRFAANQALIAQGDLTALANGAPVGPLKERLIATLKGAVNQTAAILAQTPLNGTGVHLINTAAPTYIVPESSEPGSAFGNFLRDAFGPGVNGVEGAPIVLGGGVVPTGGVRSLLADQETALNPTTQEPIEGLPDNLPLGYGQIGLPVEDLAVAPNVGVDQIPQIGREVNLEPNVTPPTGTDNEHSNFVDGGTVKREIKSRRVYRNEDNEIVEGELTTEPQLDNPEAGEVRYRKEVLEPNGFRTKLGIADGQGVNDSITQIGPATQEAALGDGMNQLIPFSFHPYSAGYEQWLYFRAYLDSFNDNFTGNWNSNQYVGRGDLFYTYQNHDRDIDFSFKAAAMTQEDLAPLYKNLNYLASSTAPTYDGNGTFMRGTLCQLTIGDYLIGTHGYISSVGFSWQTSYPWETQEGNLRVPHVLDVSVSFKPIHDFPARFNFPERGYFAGGNAFGQ